MAKYDGSITKRIKYRKGGSARSFNIFEDGKFKKAVGLSEFKRIQRLKIWRKK